MMKLELQIITILFSIVFGIIFSGVIDLIKNKVFKIKTFIQMIVFLIVTILMSLIYFYGLLKLNNGIIHPYFIIAFVLGFVVENTLKKFFKRIVLFFKK